MRVRLSAAVLALTLGLSLSPGVAAKPKTRLAPLPAGFVGMNIDGPALGASVDLGAELDRMVAVGVGQIRVVVSWADAQPYARFSDIPVGRTGTWFDVGGVPTDFSAFDRVVAAAAPRGLQILPVIEYAPKWASEHPKLGISPPATAHLSDYARFVAALVGRYGPHGTYWSDNPSVPNVPIRWWQIWNEPDLPFYWPDRPWVPGYVKLLRAAHDAVKAVDRSAQVVLAGSPDFSWKYLQEIYQAGGRRLFDIFAAHPYTRSPSHVVKILALGRAVMDRNGDARKPMVATEVSFPSSKGKTPQYGFETDERGQATNTAATIRQLAARRSALHLLAFYYYTWMGEEQPGGNSFTYAGLLRFGSGKIAAKPAYAAFRSTVLRLEGCRSKGPVVSSCTPG